MAKYLIHLLAGILLMLSSGCAKNSGALTVDNPFEAGDDPFQAAETQTVADLETASERVAAKPGWSSSRQVPTSSSASHSSPGFSHVGLAPTDNAMRFQASAPIPQITAEQPQKSPSPKQTAEAEAPAMPEIQQVQFVESSSTASPIAPASFESTMPKIRPRQLPVETQESPVTLEMPVFSEEAESEVPVKKELSAPASEEDQWWQE